MEKMNAQNGQAIEQLVAMLSSPDHFERGEAARKLCNLGMAAIGALPAILALHNDPWYQVRIQVPRAIIRMEVLTSESGDILAKLVLDEDEAVRLYAAEAQRILAKRPTASTPERASRPASDQQPLLS